MFSRIGIDCPVCGTICIVSQYHMSADGDTAYMTYDDDYIEFQCDNEDCGCSFGAHIDIEISD